MLKEATFACGRVYVWVLETVTLNYLISLHDSYSSLKKKIEAVIFVRIYEIGSWLTVLPT
jgi:hypothetical protein